MRKSVINVWFPDRSYGFIHELVSGEIVVHFLHQSNVVSGSPRSGATVIFQSITTKRGFIAVNAQVQS
jgi:hypothetical protein